MNAPFEHYSINEYHQVAAIRVFNPTQTNNMTTYFELYKKQLFLLVEEYKGFFAGDELHAIYETSEDELKKRFANLPLRVRAIPGLVNALKLPADARVPAVIEAVTSYIPTLAFLQVDVTQLQTYMKRLQALPFDDQKKLCARLAAFYHLADNALQK